ncbi:MAG: tol-pal system YbgF family protein [Kofleriaceae bacterium]
MKRTISFVLALLMVPAVASGQPPPPPQPQPQPAPRTPEDWYREGENFYNVGKFNEAVEAFKKGFELEPSDTKKSAYLYNIAQSYRQAKDCINAQFFYKRYLALKDTDTRKPLTPEKRQEVEDQITALDECAKQQEATRNKPPEVKPADPVQVTTVVKPVVVESEPIDQPKLLSTRVIGGGTLVGAGDLDISMKATLGLLAGYPIAVNDQVVIDVGAGFTWTPMPFDEMPSGAKKTGQMIGLLANAGLTYWLNSALGLRADVGVGALVFSGISQSPFTGYAPATGALGMFRVRGAGSVDYAFTKNILASAGVAFSYSPPAKNLREDITAITALDFLVGIGYRM